MLLFSLGLFSMLAYGGDVTVRATVSGSRYSGMLCASSQIATCTVKSWGCRSQWSSFVCETLLFAYSVYSFFRSKPTALRFRSEAATSVVPIPAKGSKTSSP